MRALEKVVAHGTVQVLETPWVPADLYSSQALPCTKLVRSSRYVIERTSPFLKVVQFIAHYQHGTVFICCTHLDPKS